MAACLHPGKVRAFLSTHLLSVALQSSAGLGLNSKGLNLNYILQPPTPPASLSGLGKRGGTTGFGDLGELVWFSQGKKLLSSLKAELPARSAGVKSGHSCAQPWR